MSAGAKLEPWSRSVRRATPSDNKERQGYRLDSERPGEAIACEQGRTEPATAEAGSEARHEASGTTSVIVGWVWKETAAGIGTMPNAGARRHATEGH